MNDIKNKKSSFISPYGHTAAPWSIKASFSTPVQETKADSAPWVQYIIVKQDSGGEVERIIAVDEFRYDAEKFYTARANAILISKAPEILSALETTLAALNIYLKLAPDAFLLTISASAQKIISEAKADHE